MSTIKKIISIILLITISSFTTGDELEIFNEACLNSSLCENTTIFGEDEDIDDEQIKDLVNNIFKFPDSTKTVTTTTSTESSASEKPFEPSKKIFRKKNKKTSKSEKLKSNVCNCDLSIGVCDINCCCDVDCTEHHSKVFSHCVDLEIDTDIEDWYCHKKPFFRHNETRFLLEKIVDSLFCVASDNLPPAYTESNQLLIEDEDSLKKIIDNNKLSKFKWTLEPQKSINKNFNLSNVYKYGDVVWKVHRNFKLPLELPQTGFGKACDFKKTVKFLEDWKGFCYQTSLTEKNPSLFSLSYSNFSIIAVPLKFQSQYLIKDCPENVCRPVNIFYCSESWTNCKNVTIRGFCSDAFCYNVVKRVRYVIYHNGSDGIKNIDIQFQLSNVTKSFKQEFEVSYKWFGLNQSLIFERSGNPGYIAGKPIFIGIEVNNSTEEDSAYIAFNKTHPHLTLPKADKSGMCSEVERYSVGFLEDIKLKCFVEVKVKNFSHSACIKLQNRTFEALIDFMVFNNFEKEDFDRQFVSKFGNISDNSTSNWTKMFFGEIPQNIITAQTIDNEIRCSGLVTSVLFNVVHSLITKPGSKNNHVILGVGVTFSKGVELKWLKCVGKNCEETLRLELISFVSFHDVSRPARYLIATGPNIDISLPYDFFYPFLSRTKSNAPTLNHSIRFYIILYIILSYI